MEDIRVESQNLLVEKNQEDFFQLYILRQGCGFGQLRSNFNEVDEQQIDKEFTKPFQVVKYYKRYNHFLGKIEDMAIISYPMTDILPDNIPKALLQKYTNMTKKQDKQKELTNQKKESIYDKKNNQLEFSEEEFESQDDLNDEDSCEWIQAYKFCQNCEKIAHLKVDLQSQIQFNYILEQIKQKLLIVDQKYIEPRGENFLRLKHLSQPGINYIKYNGLYLIQFHDLKQLIITFTRLFMDNYNPKLDNNLFELFKKGNSIVQKSKTISVQKMEINLYQSRKTENQLERKQPLDQEEIKPHKKKLISCEQDIEIQQGEEEEEAEEAEQNQCEEKSYSNNDMEQSIKIYNYLDKQISVKDESSHNITQSKDTAETNLLINKEKENKQAVHNENLIPQFCYPNNTPLSISDKLKEEIINQANKNFKEIILKQEHLIEVNEKAPENLSWQFSHKNDYCRKVLKNKKYIDNLKQKLENSSKFLKIINIYKFKSFEQFYKEHQSLYGQIHLSYHSKNQKQLTRSLKMKYKNKFKKLFQQIYQECQKNP
ncbi:hypothetical protein ABPG72_012224 [Tetrahymena utriculariae]